MNTALAILRGVTIGMEYGSLGLNWRYLGDEGNDLSNSGAAGQGQLQQGRSVDRPR